MKGYLINLCDVRTNKKNDELQVGKYQDTSKFAPKNEIFRSHDLLNDLNPKP